MSLLDSIPRWGKIVSAVVVLLGAAGAVFERVQAWEQARERAEENAAALDSVVGLVGELQDSMRTQHGRLETSDQSIYCALREIPVADCFRSDR